MKNRSYLVIVLLLLFMLTLGYAATNSDIKESIKGSRWSVPIKNIRVDDNSTAVGKIVDDNLDEGNLTYNTNIEKPGDFYGFKADIVNDGTIDAKIDSINVAGLLERHKRYLEYTVTYQDGTEIKINDIIKANTKKTVYVKLRMKEDIEAEDLPNEEEQIDLSLQINLVSAR